MISENHSFHFFLGLFSFDLSNSLAMLNYFSAFLMAGFPSSNRPLGNLPSGDIFFSFSKVSDSSRKVVNILLIRATERTLFLIIKPFLSTKKQVK
jgi:hypothetical protein